MVTEGLDLLLMKIAISQDLGLLLPAFANTNQKP
jgi:hypothetical protein